LTILIPLKKQQIFHFQTISSFLLFPSHLLAQKVHFYIQKASKMHFPYPKTKFLGK